MQATTIYNLLRAGGLTRAGALGMLGNMMAESGLKPNIAQRGMTTLSDEEYTKAANDGTIPFATDGVGYGLSQWTFHTRKAALLAAAHYQGVSVGDGEFQVQFCLDELISDYPAVWKMLCTSGDVDECSDIVCKQYERPAVNNLETRRNYARQLEREIKETKPKNPISATFPPDPSIMVLQAVLQFNGYWDKITGYKSKEFFEKLREFSSDMEGM